MRILGIEFGSWSLKAVELESRFRKLDVLDFHEIRLPLEISNPTETYKRAVAQLMARLPSHPDKVVTSLPAANTALRFLPIPIKSRKQVEKMYRFELEDTVPFKIHQSIVEHHVTSKKDGSLVFAAIAPEHHVMSHIDWLQSVGCDPDWLTFEGMGIVNLYLSQFDPKVSDNEPVLLLDIGHLKTNVSIYESNRLEHFRSVGWGGNAVTQSLAMALSASPEEAERFKMNDLKMDLAMDKARPEERELLMAAGQAFTPFIADINHSLVAFRTLYQKRITRALITGGSSKIWGIDNFLSQSLRVPVTHFKPFEKITLTEELKNADECRFGEGLGRALVFTRKSPLLFNFRRQAGAKESSIAELSLFFSDKNVIKLFTFAVILVAVLLVHSKVSTYLAEEEVKLARKELNKVFSETFSDVPTKLRSTLTRDSDGLRKFIGKRSGETVQKLKMLDKKRVPMLQLMTQISSAFPKGVRVDVNTLSLDDQSFTLEGVLYEGDLNLVTEKINSFGNFKNVSLKRDGKRFAYRGEVIGR